MAMPAVYLKLTLQLTSNQRHHFYNIFYYKPNATPTWTSNPMEDTSTIGVGLSALLVPNLTAVLTQSTTIVGYAYELHKDGQVYETSTLAEEPGSVLSDELPDFVAAVIQKRTATAGKSGRGRWFLGPVPEALTDENFIEDAARPSYNQIAEDWMAAGTVLGAEWRPQLMSQKNKTLMEITSTYVDNKLGSIRGRKSHSLLT